MNIKIQESAKKDLKRIFPPHPPLKTPLVGA